MGRDHRKGSHVICMILASILLMGLLTGCGGAPKDKRNEPHYLDDSMITIDAIEELLIGTGIIYGSSSCGMETGQWQASEICHAIYAKLLWDGFHSTGTSYLENAGIGHWEDDDYWWHFDFEKIKRLTEDTFGVEFPQNAALDYCYVSGNDLLIMPAFGESVVLEVQDVVEAGDILTAAGIVIYNSLYSEFGGYFKATLKKNPSSIYGCTLMSLEELEDDHSFDKLTAKASSELSESSVIHYAARAIDHDISTAWVEGVDGVGNGEWIRLETSDGSAMRIAAIQFNLGNQKSEKALEQNGFPLKLRLECENGYTQDVMPFSYTDIIVLDQPVSTSWIKLTILEARAGSVYEDTCISEISLKGISDSNWW